MYRSLGTSRPVATREKFSVRCVGYLNCHFKARPLLKLERVVPPSMELSSWHVHWPKVNVWRDASVELHRNSHRHSSKSKWANEDGQEMV